jgi:hypothetical protein
MLKITMNHLTNVADRLGEISVSCVFDRTDLQRRKKKYKIEVIIKVSSNICNK